MATKSRSRRDFVKTSIAGAAGIAISSSAASYARILGANDRVRVAFVGPGDRARDALIPSFLRLAKELNFPLTVKRYAVWYYYFYFGVVLLIILSLL